MYAVYQLTELGDLLGCEEESETKKRKMDKLLEDNMEKIEQED